MAADLEGLLDVCSRALAEAEADARDAAAEKLAEEREAAVRYASKTATELFGEEAARLIGPWTAMDDAPEDTLEAYAELDGRYARLIHIAHQNGPGEMRLSAISCRSCEAEIEVRVYTLAELADALRQAIYPMHPVGGGV